MDNIPVYLDDNQHFQMNTLVEQLKNQGVPLSDRMVSYYSYREKCFIFCGTDPLSAQ